MYGRLAFAHAAAGQAGEARSWARRSIALNWRQPRGYLAFLVASGVLIGVGAAAVITGTALAVIGVRRGRASMASLQIAPQLGPSRAGITGTIRF